MKVESKVEAPPPPKKTVSASLNGADVIWCAGYKNDRSAHYIRLDALTLDSDDKALRCPRHGSALIRDNSDNRWANSS